MHPSSRDLRPHWFICAAMLLLLLVENLVCHLWAADIQQHWDESQRVMLRSILYAIAIILFPLVNVLRHVLLRLNQTMPGPKAAKSRYLTTIAVCQILISSVGFFGVLMFIGGDGFNTLYIFSTLGVLGLFLHKPKEYEYLSIVAALADGNQSAASRR